jgi:hypothetical protein
MMTMMMMMMRITQFHRISWAALRSMELEKKAGVKSPTYGNGKDPSQQQQSACCIIPGVDCLRQVAT